MGRKAHLYFSNISNCILTRSTSLSDLERPWGNLECGEGGDSGECGESGELGHCGEDEDEEDEDEEEEEEANMWLCIDR